MAVSARGQHEQLPDPDPGIRGRHARERAPKNAGSSTGRWLRELAIIVIAALVLSALVRAFLVQAFYVPSASMENTLMVGDRILASKITTRVAGVSRGEIVVFKDPGGWLDEQDFLVEEESTGGPASWVRNALTFVGLLPSDTGEDLVKRVIGVAGDRVMCCDAQGRIVVNGVPLDEDYIIGPTDQVPFDIVVPADSVFVLGDNRGNSRDSRYHLDQNNGGVPLGNVVGRVFLVVWPFSQFAAETIPDLFGNPALDDGPNGIAPSSTPAPSTPAPDGGSATRVVEGTAPPSATSTIGSAVGSSIGPSPESSQG